MFTVSDRWAQAYPGAAIGVLAMRGVVNPERHAQLELRKRELENFLRSQYASWDRESLKTLPRMQPYIAYYRRFQKTYHVQLQLESIVYKDKSLPRVAALVEAMFMAELKNLLLTAGHDLDRVEGKTGVELATGRESYVTLGGEKRILKPGDMFIHDGKGVLSSILYGPDQRTRLTSGTTRVLFTAYAPPGVEIQDLRRHLDDLQENVSVLAPRSEVELIETHVAA
ncbi:MAG: phenylalanine--tRNA ligase beta subunit-related protein [Anaerolineales bacterium]